MKRLLPFAPLLLLGALLLSPAAALTGTKRGLDIWWGQVLPALLPSFITVRLAQNWGLLRLFRSHPRMQLMAVIGFSLLSGAPNGAKLLGSLTKEGTIPVQTADRLLPLVNNVSPVFLLSIIASGLLKNKALFPPMAIAFYGCILCLMIPFALDQKAAVSRFSQEAAKDMTFPQALSAAIESSMLDMLRIGGCILFICTLLSLIQPIVPDETAYAILAGCMEVSIGATVMAGLPLPLRWRVSLLIGASAFGGLSLFLQTLCCYPDLKPVSYLLKKLVLGGMVGLVCYLLFPLFPAVSTVFADRQQVLQRSLTLGALLFSSLLSAAFMALLSLMVAPQKKN